MARIIVAVLFSCLIATDVFAAQCKNGPCCKQSDIKGPIVQPDHNEPEEDGGGINFGGFSILSGILGVGQGLRHGTNQISTTVTKNAEGQSAYIRDTLTALGTNREEMIHARMFGPNSKAYNTFSSEDFTGGVKSGFFAVNDLSNKLRRGYQDYLHGFSSRLSRKKRLAKAPKANANVFFAGGIATTDELADAKEMSKTILDPHPALNLQERGKRMETSYNSIRKVKEAKLLVPMAIFSDMLAESAPVINMGEWPDQVYQKIGGTGSPKQTINGKMSNNSFLELLSYMRFANKDWLTGPEGLHGMTGTGVLRELLMARIDKLVVEYQKMRWMDRMAVAMAEDQFRQNKWFNDVLNTIYSQSKINEKR